MADITTSTSASTPLSNAVQGALTEMSTDRGLIPNEVIIRAIKTQKLIDDNVDLSKGEELLVKKADGTFVKINFE